MRWTYITNASVSYSGAEQEEEEKKNREEKEEEEKSYNNSSPYPGKVVVAVAVRTPPLMALQHSIMRTILLDRSVQIHLDFHRQRLGASLATSDTTRV